MYRENNGKSEKAERVIYEETFKGSRISLSLKPPKGVYLPIQRHTDIVLKLSSIKDKRRKKVGDAVITNLKGLKIGIKTADCVPIVLIGEDWVGVIHAGWRGLYKGIVEKTIKALREEGEEQLFAFVFPSAKACCYEVGEEFRKLFAQNLFERRGKLYFDPQEEAIKRLNDNRINLKVVLRECTICNKEYPSYRRDRTEERLYTSVVKL